MSTNIERRLKEHNKGKPNPLNHVHHGKWFILKLLKPERRQEREKNT
ncbi:hypothetical protein [Flagellimonas sp.]